MRYITATADMADRIHHILYTTIKAVYPKYYPREVADFFCRLHSREHILEGIASGNMGVLVDGDTVIGTGCYDKNHITGVYVLPNYQNQGCGSKIMDHLEAEISKKYDTAVLDASLPASRLYEHRGYKTIKHEQLPVENGAVLVYEVMEKKLDPV